MAAIVWVKMQHLSSRLRQNKVLRGKSDEWRRKGDVRKGGGFTEEMAWKERVKKERRSSKRKIKWVRTGMRTAREGRRGG